MKNLNAEQVKQLADNFMQMANALGDYRYNNIDSLSEEENLKLKEIHSNQLTQTTELYTRSAVLVLDDVQKTLNKINSITMDTQELFKKLTTAQSIIDRASSILNLASAILSLDIKGTNGHIQELIS